LAEEVRNLKTEHQNEKSKKDPTNNRFIWIPVLYGLILEPYSTRYYPYGDFMANILWFVDRNWVAYYWIEQYYDEMLKGRKGEIKGRSSWMAGNVWTNEFEIIQPVDWSDIYVTIDIGLQREAEQIAKQQLKDLRADAISILVLDSENGKVKASVSAPSFNPNSYNDAYTLQPLG
jgi:stage V sporulation protein D (sporulation-specific penicillin-binding protein)